jgi:hypothetical protein
MKLRTASLQKIISSELNCCLHEDSPFYESLIEIQLVFNLLALFYHLCVTLATIIRCVGLSINKYMFINTMGWNL